MLQKMYGRFYFTDESDQYCNCTFCIIIEANEISELDFDSYITRGLAIDSGKKVTFGLITQATWILLSVLQDNNKLLDCLVIDSLQEHIDKFIEEI